MDRTSSAATMPMTAPMMIMMMIVMVTVASTAVTSMIMISVVLVSVRGRTASVFRRGLAPHRIPPELKQSLIFVTQYHTHFGRALRACFGTSPRAIVIGRLRRSRGGRASAVSETHQKH
mmetsp:Transcript_146051/g.269422  ORF Transcript_146051/g.269422 Transcript_146051/m.269422 type:complete len:119 (+) Transcript_146051:2089-2445(+)